MNNKITDWDTIANSPNFIKLHRKKTTFLLSLWIFGVFSYFLLPLGAFYAPTLFKMKIIGRMNVGYIYCLYQFFMTVAIAIYYTYRTNRDFDPLTKTVLEEIVGGESQ